MLDDAFYARFFKDFFCDNKGSRGESVYEFNFGLMIHNASCLMAQPVGVKKKGLVL